MNFSDRDGHAIAAGGLIICVPKEGRTEDQVVEISPPARREAAG